MHPCTGKWQSGVWSCIVPELKCWHSNVLIGLLLELEFIGTFSGI